MFVIPFIETTRINLKLNQSSFFNLKKIHGIDCKIEIKWENILIHRFIRSFSAHIPTKIFEKKSEIKHRTKYPINKAKRNRKEIVK